MADREKPIPEAAFVTLTSRREDGAHRGHADVVAAALCPAFMSLVIPLLIAGCMTTQVFAVAAFCAVVTAASLGALTAVRPSSGLSFAGAGIVVLALAAMLAIPDAREGLFSVCNGAISHYDDAFDAYVPLVSQAGLVAGSVVFAVCAGLLSGALAWFASRLKSVEATLLILVALCSAGIRLSLGLGLAGSCVGIASWLMQCRWRQLRGSSYSAGIIAVSMGVGIVGCCGIFFACAMLFSPSGAIEDAHDAMRGTVDAVRFGEGSTPEGDLEAATKMNEGEGSVAATFSEPISNDVLLRGFVGASYENGAWTALDHNAYEGEWAHMTSWLSSNGMPCATQRAAYDDASAEAEGAAQPNTVEVAIDASDARTKFTYVPYTLRDIAGSSANGASEGALRAGLLGDASYRFTMDDVPAADMLADASWLEGSSSAYASVESVYSAFCHEKYLAVSDEDASAIEKYLFNNATWDDSAEVSDYAVISRVRTMMETLASYTTSPKAPDASVPFAEWLFGEARAGNSASFATAAVLAFRAQGIPARYAEGYRATASDIAEAVSAGEPLVLGSEDVHAWAEVYLDGIGWTPVEVTPGFYAQSLKADSVVDVAEAKSSGESDEVLQSGSVSGQTEEDDAEADEPSASVPVVLVVAVCALSLAAFGALCVGVAFVQRKVRLSKRREHMESDDEAVAVPALYRNLAIIMKCSVTAFDEAKPLECLDGFASAFPGIDPQEYRRAIALYQHYTFGARELKPHEMRTLRRFGERLHNEMPPAKTVPARLRRTFVDAL